LNLAYIFSRKKISLKKGSLNDKQTEKLTSHQINTTHCGSYSIENRNFLSLGISENVLPFVSLRRSHQIGLILMQVLVFDSLAFFLSRLKNFKFANFFSKG
jgi:hypothetical protein